MRWHEGETALSPFHTRLEALFREGPELLGHADDLQAQCGQFIAVRQAGTVGLNVVANDDELAIAQRGEGSNHRRRGFESPSER